MSIIWKIVISRLSGSPGPFVSRICIHTPTHAHARARAVHCCADADAQCSSSVQFRAIQVRLALRTSDTVTVYPSPTHTRAIATREEEHRPSRVEAANACDDARPRWRRGRIEGEEGKCSWRDAASVCCCYVPLLGAEVEDARPRRRPSPSLPLEGTASSSRDPRRELRGRRPEHGQLSGLGE